MRRAGVGGKYRTTNWKAYNAALKARGDLTIWLDRDMQRLAVPSGKRWRAVKLSQMWPSSFACDHQVLVWPALC